MNVAMIFAGGTGQRMHMGTVPKQFLRLYGKPIIVYTLEIFEKNPDVDAIVVACLESWVDEMNRLVKEFDLKKVVSVVPGGSTGQESIFNGLTEVRRLYGEDEVIVLIHDGVRPLVDSETVSSTVRCAREKGNGVTVTQATETVVQKEENERVSKIMDRKTCFLARAPQTYHLKELYACHLKARAEGRNDFIDSASIMHYYGYDLYTVEGNAENIKITKAVDFYIFRAIMDARDNSQVFG